MLVIARFRRQREEGVAAKMGWQHLTDIRKSKRKAMPAEVSSLLSAHLNRVLKELSREMRRIRTRIALDPNYPFMAECTSDLAALMVADKVLASIQRKMINPSDKNRTKAKVKVTPKAKPVKKKAFQAKQRSLR
jgi:hypothetical protein